MGNLTSIAIPRNKSNKPSSWHFVTINGIPKSKTLRRGMSPQMLEQLQELEDLRYWPHPFRSISECLTFFDLPEVKFKGWRLTDYVLGYANYNNDIRGRMLCTNGVMCILRGENDVLHTIHLDAFVHENNLPNTYCFSTDNGRMRLAKQKEPSVLDGLEGLL